MTSCISTLCSTQVSQSNSWMIMHGNAYNVHSFFFCFLLSQKWPTAFCLHAVSNLTNNFSLDDEESMFLWNTGITCLHSATTQKTNMNSFTTTRTSHFITTFVVCLLLNSGMTFALGWVILQQSFLQSSPLTQNHLAYADSLIWSLQLVLISPTSSR